MLNQKERRALALLLWLPVIGWLVSNSAVVSLPHSAWRSATDPLVVEETRHVLPQGWAFFTRDPQEPQITAYVYGGDNEWTAVPHPATNSARSLFGIKRDPRLFGHELGHVVSGIPPDEWVECERVDHLGCLRSLTPTPGVLVENPYDPPHLCGTVGLVQQEPVPWAWREDAESIRMPLAAAAMEVSCEPQ